MTSEAAPPEGQQPPATVEPTIQSTRRRRWPWVVALLAAFSLFLAGGAFAGATVSYADSLQGRLLPGTTVAGLDVGSKTHAEALKIVRSGLADELDRTMVVRWRGQRWKAKARALGARNNAKAIITRVAQSQAGLTWQDWAKLRWFGERADTAANVKVKYRRAAVERFVRSIAEDVRAEPVDAALEVVGDDVAITPSAVGYAAREAKAVDALMKRLRGKNKPVRLRVKTLDPDVEETAFDQVLLLDQSEHRLTLHLDGEKTHSWIVATGTGDYPTPLGQYSVVLKRYMPTWVNPDPDGWGRDMPESIPPGKNNPLGVRALNWNASAIRFHGTQAIDSLGTDASHGCVRMSNADVIQLYDLVDVGAVIISRT